MTDSRFFPGYVWCSNREDCRAGLCIPGNDPAEAAFRFASANGRFQYTDKPTIVFTLASADAVPVRHECVRRQSR